MIAGIAFATVTTLMAFAFLVIFAAMDSRFESVRSCSPGTRDLSVTAVALTAAWSWEHCYMEAFQVVGDSFNMAYGDLIPKICLAILVPAILLPPHVLHIKARVIDLEAQRKHKGRVDSNDGRGSTDHSNIVRDAAERSAAKTSCAEGRVESQAMPANSSS
eukprot:TRINITY_DN73391_c0_g1_i1.p1 TRINITY_DN73391_c0_g1~~TRINITY_DN73391_c0_g1_i1.p1  ORF type:complete len:187 (-),score=8.17 TRINITY_DN73391_c0_g1_i1:222-704(-)